MPIVNKKEKKSFAIELTKWRNNLDVVQSFILYPVGNPQSKGYEPLEVILEPGEELEIPSEYDHIIHQTRVDARGKNATIVGGLAPMLTKVGGKAKLHPSLDVKFQEKKYQMKDLVNKKIEKEVLEQLMQEQSKEVK